MLFTPLWFWGLRRELADFAVGATVIGGRFNYPAFRLSLARTGETRDLVFWLDPAFARAEWSEPRETGMLPGAWRALDSAHCCSVEQPHCDRRLRLTFAADENTLVLDFFAFGRSGLRLSNPEADSEEIASSGQIPGDPAPPNTPLVTELAANTPRPELTGNDLVDWLHSKVRGLDSLWIEAVEAVAGESAEAAWAFVCEQGAALQKQPLQAYVVERAGTPAQVSLVDFSTQLPELHFSAADSLSAAAGRVVYHLRKQRERTYESERILSTARSMRGRLKRRLRKLQEDARQQQDHAIWQENADWLTAKLGQIQQGETSLIVPTADGTREVELDPSMPPSRLAKRWYHKARRLRRGLDITRRQLEEAEQELARIDAALSAARAEDPSTPEDSAAWEELQKLTTTAMAGSKRSKTEARLPFRRFRSPGGLAVWVGRNNKENDELTLHHAHKRDLWFHAQQTPGSHVVLRSHALSQAPAKADIIAAAAVAAFFSKARHSSKVPVIYTEARYVRKPRKAPPGQVLVEREKSVMVAPETLPEWNEDDSR